MVGKKQGVRGVAISGFFFPCQTQHGHLYVCLCVHISKVELYIASAQPSQPGFLAA